MKRYIILAIFLALSHLVYSQNQLLYVEGGITLTVESGITTYVEGGVTTVSGAAVIDNDGAIHIMEHSSGRSDLENDGTDDLSSGSGTWHFTGTTNQHIQGNAVIFEDLTLNGTGGVTLDQDITVNGTCTFTSGDLTTSSSNTLTYGTGASCSGGGDDSHVVGPIIHNTNSTTQIAHIVGSGSQSIVVKVTPSSTNATQWQFEYNSGTVYGGDACLGSSMAGGVKTESYVDVSRNSGTADATTLCFQLETASAVDVNEIFVMHGTGSCLEKLAATKNSGSTTDGVYCTDAAVTSFSPFTMGSDDPASPLPIELLYFNAEWLTDKQESVEITWATATEVDNDYFEIQRSSDAVNFKVIHIEDAVGNSSETIEYITYDNDPSPTVNYYRLKQIDEDGSYTYSPIVAVQGENDADLVISNMGYDVGSNSLNFNYNGDITGNESVNIEIVDLSGRVLMKRNEPVLNVNNKVLLNRLLPTGLYSVRMEMSNLEEQFTSKIVMAN